MTCGAAQQEGARIPQVWGHVASSPHKRESSAERQFRGDFTLRDERPSYRNTYLTLHRARGHAGSNDNITTRTCVTTRKGVKPKYHIDHETTPRLHPRRTTVRALHGTLHSAPQYVHGPAVTTRKDVTTRKVGQPNNLPGLSIPTTRRELAPREPPRGRAAHLSTESPTTRPGEAASTDGSQGTHHQKRRDTHLGPLPHHLHPGRAGHPHHPHPREEGSGESLARP